MTSKADMWVLDAVADDIEGFDDVCRNLNSDAIGWKREHGGPFELEEVAITLKRLVQADLIQVLVVSSSRPNELVTMPRQTLPDFALTQAWFMLTAIGRHAHESWCTPS